jgi:CRISPR-associated protein Cmr4
MTMPAGKLIWLRAETFIHAGVGQQTSVVDQPFAREGATGYPYIPGSGVKGGLRDAYWLGKDSTKKKDEVTNDLFGKSDDAGKILFSDARLAFLPVRTLGNTYRYVTSAGLLKRLQRDFEFVGEMNWRTLRRPEGQGSDNKVLGLSSNGQIFLEEFPFEAQGHAVLANIPGLTEVQEELNARLAILDDSAFDYFARHGLFVRQRNALDDETKTAKGTALWSEESLPPDTLMYVVLTPRLPRKMTTSDEDPIKTLLDKCGGYSRSAAMRQLAKAGSSCWIWPPPSTRTPLRKTRGRASEYEPRYSADTTCSPQEAAGQQLGQLQERIRRARQRGAHRRSRPGPVAFAQTKRRDE